MSSFLGERSAGLWGSLDNLNSKAGDQSLLNNPTEIRRECYSRSESITETQNTSARNCTAHHSRGLRSDTGVTPVKLDK
ncbi:hypothetical protein RRG08_025659 [Elysia crispata]|uniref:Uncharacterized protein n=1 Tax=Elysia crispata TaxID=231223 RepID=A0AAE1CXC3_9GAST|nr:hypothetical protein RRG08_025659 [Elysia crispata]